MRKQLSILLILTTQLISFAQVQNNSISEPGDIIIVAYHDNPDGFSFLLLDDCPNNTTIKFIDEEWTGNSFASTTTEGEVTWVNSTGEIISQGTVVHIENANDNSPGIQASIGTATESDGGFSLDLTDDEIIAITGTRASYGTFLSYFGDSDSPGSTLSGTTLVDGEKAIYQPTVTEGYYNGPDTCSNLSISDCAKQFTNISNWNFGSYNYPEDVIGTIQISGVLKSDDTKNSINFSIYPNPVQNYLSIRSKGIIYAISIYDIMGQLVFSQTTSETEISIKLSHLPRGYYILKTDTEHKNFIYKFQKK